ncbi:hypothetical protein Tco_1421696 [Tanacetum coccineum]
MLVVTSGDARSWYMISGDAKSWVVCIYSLSYSTIVHYNVDKDDNPKCWPACCPSREGGTGGRAGRGGVRTRGRSGDQGNGRIDGQGGQVGGQGSKVNDDVNGVLDFSTIIAQQLQNLLPTIVAQVGDQGRGQGNGRNKNSDAINDNIWGDVRNVNENNDPYTCWIKKMESVQDMSGCEINQKVKYTAGSFVGKSLTWWNSQIHTRGREAAIGMDK